MRLTILGAGTLVPHPERGNPGFVVKAGGDTLLFDGGSGTLYRGARCGINWREISHIFYTHYHPDHTLEMVSFLFACNYTPDAQRYDPLFIYGPPGLKEFYRKVTAAWPSVIPQNYQLNLRELAPGEEVESSSGWQVQTALMAHGETESLAYRISYGSKSLVYSGDTQYCEALVKLARGADLLLCECSSDDSRRCPGHLSPSGVARIVRESGVSRVLLTHIYPPANPAKLARECAEKCKADVQPARDMGIYEI